VQTHARAGSAILAQVERPYERSSLFEWLMTHHDEMVAAADGRRIEWSRLCGEFAKVGLTGADRKPANAATARETWQRVRKEHARIARGVPRRTRVGTCPRSSRRATMGRPSRPRRNRRCQNLRRQRLNRRVASFSCPPLRASSSRASVGSSKQRERSRTTSSRKTG
jgi:hypothetical protein